jgi:hypothetical protein
MIATWMAAFLLIATPSNAIDANHDGMEDAWQTLHSIGAFTGSADPDNDGRPNLVESINGTNPSSTASPNSGWGFVHIIDANGDLLDDGWARSHLRNGTPLQPYDDDDNDGRKNIEESIVGSNPWVADQPWQSAGEPSPTVGPGSFTLTFRSIPTMRYLIEQSDDLITWTENQQLWGDGSVKTLTIATGTSAAKFFRVGLVLTNGGNLDTDGDGLPDWYELNVFGSNPSDADSDDDGLPDGWEAAHGLNVTGPTDALADADSDSLTNRDEFAFGLDPRTNEFESKASSMTYTVVNRLAQIETGGVVTNSFTYDAEGNLINAL